MTSLGYGVVETVASPDGRNGRVDSCGLYFREDNWKCLDHETIFLDDLAIIRSSSLSENELPTQAFEAIPKSKRNRGGSSSSTNISSLKGLERSFVRKNVALLAKLEHKHTRQQMVVVVAHLFWNPTYDYVKVRTNNLNHIFPKQVHF